MPDVSQKQLLAAVTTDGTKAGVNVRNMTSYSVFIRATGGTSASVQFEGTADPAGVSGFLPVGTRPQGGGAYATTAIAMVPATPKSVFFDPADNLTWIRAVVTLQTGPTSLDAWLTGEI